MTSPTNKDIVLNAWQTFRTRDATLIAAAFAPDAEWIAPGRNATAVALDHTDHMIGAEAIARFISTEMHRLFSEIDIAFRAVHADGDSVIVEERMRAILPGGKPYDNDYSCSWSRRAASSRCANTWTRARAGRWCSEKPRRE
ncbi:nuclear transport factor 2 family protein [Bradyrhizobium sp. UFLA03-84]|uniref:nuclear transport factor 2 family protein n=1 Tax=Bradyrhizobium sp. UFLA03-84 TaxID=418599 RepID=UPI001304398B|nr:nuclear transport factor 2 family protein [Bradyrhizobium sp. UFLA03-84]